MWQEAESLWQKRENVFLKKSWNRKFSYNLATIPGAVVSYAPDGVVDSRFLLWVPAKVYQEELDEIRENNYPKQMVDLFEKEGRAIRKNGCISQCLLRLWKVWMLLTALSEKIQVHRRKKSPILKLSVSI